MSNTVICPHCQREIEVTEVLATQLRSQIQQEFDVELRRKEASFADRETKLKQQQEALSAEKDAIDEEVKARLKEEEKRLEVEALVKARETVSLEIKDSQAELSELKQKLTAAQEAELVLRKDRRELEEQKSALQLGIARQLDEERSKIRDTAKKEALEERQLKEAEKDKLIGDLRLQLDDMSRKAEQGSQQTQGEVLELVLEESLRQFFPYDMFVPVPKGVHGGDVLQIVHDATGTECGTILWESKRTKAWSDAWLPKLRDDQRAAKAHLAILVSMELPKTVDTFNCVDGIWVTNRQCALVLASALRCGLIDTATARRSADGKHTKMELLYNYLSGQEFRHRVEGIVESFVTLKDDLEAEKRSMQRVWAKREKQIERAVTCTAGLYGDLSGIIGRSLPKIEKLELPLVESTYGSTEQEES